MQVTGILKSCHRHDFVPAPSNNNNDSSRKSMSNYSHTSINDTDIPQLNVEDNPQTTIQTQSNKDDDKIVDVKDNNDVSDLNRPSQPEAIGLQSIIYAPFMTNVLINLINESNEISQHLSPEIYCQHWGGKLDNLRTCCPVWNSMINKIASMTTIQFPIWRLLLSQYAQRIPQINIQSLRPIEVLIHLLSQWQLNGHQNKPGPYPSFIDQSIFFRIKEILITTLPLQQCIVNGQFNPVFALHGATMAQLPQTQMYQHKCQCEHEHEHKHEHKHEHDSKCEHDHGHKCQHENDFENETEMESDVEIDFVQLKKKIDLVIFKLMKLYEISNAYIQ
eukprot:349025_1